MPLLDHELLAFRSLTSQRHSLLPVVWRTMSTEGLSETFCKRSRETFGSRMSCATYDRTSEAMGAALYIYHSFGDTRRQCMFIFCTNLRTAAKL